MNTDNELKEPGRCTWAKMRKPPIPKFRCPRCGKYVMTLAHVEQCCGPRRKG